MDGQQVYMCICVCVRVCKDEAHLNGFFNCQGILAFFSPGIQLDGEAKEFCGRHRGFGNKTILDPVLKPIWTTIIIHQKHSLNSFFSALLISLHSYTRSSIWFWNNPWLSWFLTNILEWSLGFDLKVVFICNPFAWIPSLQIITAFKQQNTNSQFARRKRLLETII